MIDKITVKLKEKFISPVFVCNTLYILSILHIALMLLLTANPSVWMDDVYTLGMIKFPLSELWGVVTLDVHPPLYFFYVKIVAAALSAITPLSFITASKIASVFPFIALIIIGKTQVAKNWGEYCGAVFAFLMAAAPQMVKYGIEIRMYSLALMFVTLAFIYGFNAAKFPNLKNFVLLAAFSALSAWTHYFACIAAVFVYIALAIWFIQKDKKQLVKLILSGIGVSVAYLPWLTTAFNALKNVSDGFWIGSITLKTLILYGVFPFQIRTEVVSSFMLCLIFLAAGAYFVFVLKDKSNEKAISVHFALFGLAIPICTVLVGVVVSYLVTPVFISRYMFPALGCLWLAFAVALTFGSDFTELRKMMISAVLLVLVIMVGLNNLATGYNEYKKYVVSANTKAQIFDEINSNDIIICDSSHVAGITAYLTNAKRIYNYNPKPSAQGPTLFNTILPQVEIIADFKTFENIYGNYDTVWILFTSAYNANAMEEYCDQQGITYNLRGMYTYEDYAMYTLVVAD